MDSSRSLEDDTIRDQNESGAVATRPRFTRARRTWKINTRNLTAEDARVIDYFSEITAARGGNAFLYPNLLLNWSFEIPAASPTELVRGWYVASAAIPQLAITVATTGVEDGLQALGFNTVAGQSLAVGQYLQAVVNSRAQIPCTPGEVYLFHGRVNPTPGTLPDYWALSANVAVNVTLANGTTTQMIGTWFNTATPGWQDFWYSFTIPPNAVSFSLGILGVLNIHNTAVGTINLDGSASILWDEVGCSLLTPVQPYGRMAGSAPLGRPVRFTKLPEISDIGYGNGQKVYGTSFELTEV